MAEKAVEDAGKNVEELSRIFARYSVIMSNMPEKTAVTKPYYHMLLFTDPFQYCDEDIMRGIHTRIQRLSHLLGGSAYGRNGDCTLFCERRAVMALIATTKNVGYACENGLTLRSRKPYIVTSAKDRVVYGINRKRAIDLYSEITGLGAESLLKEKWLVNHTAVDYPFAVFDNEGKKWMRAPFAANEDGSITFATRMAICNILFK